MLQYSPKIVTDSLVMCLDPSQNKSYPTTDLPVKNGLVMWLDSADDTTFSYSSGTVVSQWRDKSGLNNHVAQSTVANQPSRSSTLNSRKIIVFDGSNDSLSSANSLDLSTTHTIFAIASQSVGSSDAGLVSINNTLNNGMTLHNASAYYAYFGDGSKYVSYGIGASTYYIFTKVFKGSSSTTRQIYLNGTSATTSGTITASDTTGVIRLGQQSTYLNGTIAEVIIFNRELTATELKQVHTYLGQKWGISNTDRSIVDLSGNNNNGLLGDGVTADMPLFDVYNKGALKLDGSTDYVAVSNATSLNPATVTVSIWVKRNGYQSQTANYLRRNYNDAYAILSSPTDDSALRFRIHNGSTYPESPTTTLALNEWTNIVGTYDLANIKIYKNGVFIGQTAHTSAISYASANTTLTIGRDDPIAGRYMNANYGSVLIYSRALSAAEIAQNYEAQKSKFANTIVQQGLVLNLDAGNPYSYAGAGTTWFDVSGNNNDLTIAGSPTYSSTQGWTFTNGSTANYMIKNPITFPTTTISVEVWCKTSGPGSTAIFSYASSVADNDFLIFDPSNVSLYTANGAVASGINITDGNWKQIVRTSNRSTGAEVLYVNGISQFTTTLSAGTLVTTGGSLVLAQEQDSIGGGFDPNQAFGGNITIVRVYNRILTATEILQNYNDTKGRFGL